MVSMTRNDLRLGEPSGFSSPRRISIAGACGRCSPRTVLDGREKFRATPSPTWWAERSAIAIGTGGDGATGSPGAPQPVMAVAMAIASKPKLEIRNAAAFRAGLAHE